MLSEKLQIEIFLLEKIKPSSIHWLVTEDYIIIASDSAMPVYTWKLFEGINNIKPITYLNILPQFIVLCFNAQGVKTKYPDLKELVEFDRGKKQFELQNQTQN